MALTFDPPRPHALWSLLAPLAAASVALLATSPASAQVLNVSALVTGNAQRAPIIWQGSTQKACGTACQYAVTSSAGSSAVYAQQTASQTVNAWPPVFGATLPAIGSVSQVLAVPPPPEGVLQDGGAPGVARRAEVQYAWQPLLGGARQMQVQTWKGGSGASTVSMSIRITPTATKAHYLAFTVPKTSHISQEAFYVGGPSGQQPLYKPPTQMQSRSAVDVYADGLPIWSGAANKLRPQRWNSTAISHHDLLWGPGLDESTVHLYLGNLSAGVTRTIALVFRADLRVNADTCYVVSDYGNTVQRCDSRLQALTLPSVRVNHGSGLYTFSSYRPDVRVYTY